MPNKKWTDPSVGIITPSIHGTHVLRKATVVIRLLAIGSVEAERCLEHICITIDEVGATDPTRQRLHDYFTETARTLADPYLPLYRLPLDELRTMLEQTFFGKSLQKRSYHV